MLYSLIAGKLVALARDCGAIKAGEEVVYQFAFEALVGHLFSFATMFGIAFLCGIPQYILLYIVLMYPLRTYSGGFHASTPERCYLISTIMFVGMIACEGWIAARLTAGILAAFLLSGAAVIFALAPVESKNKPLDEAEVRKYRRIARSIVVLETLLVIVMYVFHLSARSVYYALSAQVTVALLLIIPYLTKLIHSIGNKGKGQEKSGS